MKFIPAQLAYFLKGKSTQRNIVSLVRFLVLITVLVIGYSIIFHYIMEAEGRSHSWVTGLYWTLTVMSTLGFGDITFHSDLGRFFSLIVLMSGIIFLLVLLPFSFIQFFYAPWLEAKNRAQAPRELPTITRNHVLITSIDPVGMSLIDKFRSYQTPYALLVDDLQTALDHHDAGVRVVLGDRDDPDTYRRLQLQQASLVIANGTDERNTNVVATVRELNPDVPIISTADSPDSVDIMSLAGSTQVLQLREMLGRALARRVIGSERHANIIAHFDELAIAEAPTNGTRLVGLTLGSSHLRQDTGVTVIGMWDRGAFVIPTSETRIGISDVLVIAGTDAQLAAFNRSVRSDSMEETFVLILGGGRVGRHAARALREMGHPFVIVEKNAEELREDGDYVIGSAADIDVMLHAGIGRATSVIITTQNDDTNIYLTIYCRHLRPDIHIISRATMERNISTLHRAGANLVLSYASLGSNAIMNFLQDSRLLMLTEGLDIMRAPVPSSLAGTTLQQTGIRAKTGCSIIALRRDGSSQVNPDPHTVLESDMEMVFIGRVESLRRLLDLYDIQLRTKET
ncbi:MAG: NAD-binding protein [Bacteroidota bacterium]|nr:NAD-binding protein [Bacteroidota bacterium]